MIGYICKYTPIEVFEAMGEEVVRIEPEVTSFNQADTLMHPNICSFAKGLLETVLDGQYEAIILTTCCDSIRRVYDILKEKLPNTFVYILDTPRIIKDAGICLYEKRIREMIEAYEQFSGKKYDDEKLEKVLMGKFGTPAIKTKKDTLNVGILGARANPNIDSILEKHGINVAFDLTCTGLDRKILVEPDHLFHGYVRGLLTQFPCMRMEAAAGRDELIQRYAESVDGVIFHTIQFCDNYSYEYAWLRDKLKKPMLLLETDNTTQSYGQVLTRIEAFIESLEASGGHDHKRDEIRNRRVLAGGKDMYVLGIDSGSTSTNAVIMDQNRKIKAFDVVRTGAKSGESAQRILDQVLEKAGLTRDDISWIVSTGYGRVSIHLLTKM